MGHTIEGSNPSLSASPPSGCASRLKQSLGLDGPGLIEDRAAPDGVLLGGAPLILIHAPALEQQRVNLAGGIADRHPFHRRPFLREFAADMAQGGGI